MCRDMYREDLAHFVEKDKGATLYSKFIMEYCLKCLKHNPVNCDKNQIGECAIEKVLNGRYVGGMVEET